MSEGPEQPPEAGTVLVIEDDESITRLLRLYLNDAGFRVLAAGDGRAGLALHNAECPDLVILDLMLPGFDGWQVCRRIREHAHTPILMLTARESEQDRIAGLDLGADDYVTKPFSPRELVSRVRAILRRAGEGAAGRQNQPPGGAREASRPQADPLSFPGLTIVPAARRVEVEGRRIELTAKEFDVLLALASAPGRVFSREELLSQVWGYDYLGDSRTVDVHIGTLRKKIEPEPRRRRYVRTVFRVGYAFEPDETDLSATDQQSEAARDDAVTQGAPQKEQHVE
jgi:two-component system response regulator ResD